MSKQHNHLWGSNYVLQHLARAVVAAAGPPCFRQQVQLTIWQLTPMEGVIQSSRGRVDPMQALLGSQSQSQQTSKPLTQEEEGGGGQHGGGGGGDGTDEGRMHQLCFHSQELDRPAVFFPPFFSGVASFLSSGRTHLLCYFFLFLLSSHLKVITKGFIYVINHFLFMPVEELLWNFSY